MSESLRPDLHGEVLYLTNDDTMALLPGETATLTVHSVEATTDQEFVDVLGDWSGPKGDDPHARVEVHVASLPGGVRR